MATPLTVFSYAVKLWESDKFINRETYSSNTLLPVTGGFPLTSIYNDVRKIHLVVRSARDEERFSRVLTIPWLQIDFLWLLSELNKPRSDVSIEFETDVNEIGFPMVEQLLGRDWQEGPYSVSSGSLPIHSPTDPHGNLKITYDRSTREKYKILGVEFKANGTVKDCDLIEGTK